MSKIDKYFNDCILQYSHSPIVDTIGLYSSCCYNELHPLSLANKCRVSRYNGEQIVFQQDVIPCILNQFRRDRQLFIHFLRRLISPVFQSELQSFMQLENIVFRIQLITNTVEEFGLWEQHFQLEDDDIIKLMQSNSIDQFISSLTLISQKLVIKSIPNTEPTQVIKQGYCSDYYINYYVPSSKKKVNQRRQSLLSDDQQTTFLQRTNYKKCTSFIEIFNYFLKYFNYECNKSINQAGQQWMCTLTIVSISVTKKANDKRLALLDCQLNIVKMIAPMIFDNIMKEANTDYSELLKTYGKMQIQMSIQHRRFALSEQYQQDVPIDHRNIEEYIKSFNNQQTSTIRKIQNEVIEHLLRKLDKFKVQKQIESVGASYELRMQFINKQGEQMEVKKVFTTQLHFSLGKLIAQAYLIEYMSRLQTDIGNAKTLKQLLCLIS